MKEQKGVWVLSVAEVLQVVNRPAHENDTMLPQVVKRERYRIMQRVKELAERRDNDVRRNDERT